MSFASKVYRLLPSATINIDALKRPISKTCWANRTSALLQTGGLGLGPFNDVLGEQHIPLMNGLSGESLGESSSERDLAYPCVAYLESGYCDIEPSHLVGVIALSSADSLYSAIPVSTYCCAFDVANCSQKLLCDPYESPGPYELKQIQGNIGRAGITMLVPPQEPMLREYDPNAWPVISTSSFNGQPEDHFAQTTVHLSFTDYNSPLYDGVRGGQDSQVSLLETVVSIHDRGAWVGDIDVLSATRDGLVQKLLPPQGCAHESGVTPANEMLSIESWDEILEPPIDSMVVRANGNWIARLAATAVLVQTLKSKPPADTRAGMIVLCPKSVCWRCVDPTAKLANMVFSPPLPSHRRIYLY